MKRNMLVSEESMAKAVLVVLSRSLWRLKVEERKEEF